MIEIHDLTKLYGAKRAVDNVTFTVQSGKVTGFLGPNGAGKSTTMRLILGLDHPTSGAATINGTKYADIKAPLREVGALLDAKAAHPGRSARTHLRAMAATEGISKKRVDEVINLAGLDAVADKNVGGFSLGMGQRLGIASALLGDPETLILDEPVNGLDPEGVQWVRNLVKYLAGQGRTIFLSSHLMSEMSLTADHLVILGQGHVLADTPLDAFIEKASGIRTRVRSAQAAQIIEHFHVPARSVDAIEPGLVVIDGVKSDDIGEAAAHSGWVLHELTPVETSLEHAYMQLTEAAQEYSSGVVGGAGGPGGPASNAGVPAAVGGPAAAGVPGASGAPMPGVPVPGTQAPIPQTPPAQPFAAPAPAQGSPIHGVPGQSAPIQGAPIHSVPAAPAQTAPSPQAQPYTGTHPQPGTHTPILPQTPQEGGQR